MATLHDAIKEIQVVIGALNGIKRAPVNPPEQMDAFPFVVCYARTGVLKSGPIEQMTGLHDLIVELHMSREPDLPKVIGKLMDFSNLIPNALFLAIKNSTFTTVQTFGPINYTFGPLGWGGVATVGWTFTLVAVKIQSVVA